jgi:hypothetical protein
VGQPEGAGAAGKFAIGPLDIDRLLQKIEPNDRTAFNQVLDACSDVSARKQPAMPGGAEASWLRRLRSRPPSPKGSRRQPS